MINIEEFIELKVVSNSAKKSYFTLFKNILEFETYNNKEVQKWNKMDCLNFLSNLGSKKYNTVAVKWSLLKKYLIFIGNDITITREELEGIEDSVVRYVSWEEVFKAIEIFENNLDKALILMIRNGIKGEEFIELSELKTENIKGNFVQLPNRIVELNTDVEKVVDKAKKELGYRMNVKQSEEEGKRIAYSYYRYNGESEYFWKNRPNKFNHNGLDSMKPSARKIKINNLISRIGNSDITTTSLTVSYVVDKILETERSLGITLSEGQTKTFIDNLGIKVSLYTTYAIKNSMGK